MSQSRKVDEVDENDQLIHELTQKIEEKINGFSLSWSLSSWSRQLTSSEDINLCDAYYERASTYRDKITKNPTLSEDLLPLAISDLSQAIKLTQEGYLTYAYYLHDLYYLRGLIFNDMAVIGRSPDELKNNYINAIDNLTKAINIIINDIAEADNNNLGYLRKSLRLFYSQRGGVFKACGKYFDAFSDYRRSIKIVPERMSSVEEIEIGEGKFTASDKYFFRCNEIAKIYFSNMKDDKNALIYVEKILKDDPKNISALILSSDITLNLKGSENKINKEMYETTIKDLTSLNPKDLDLIELFTLGLAYKTVQNDEKAFECFAEAIELYKQNPTDAESDAQVVMNIIGGINQIYLAQGTFEKGVELSTLFLESTALLLGDKEQRRSQSVFYNYRATANFHLGNMAEALNDATESIKLYQHLDSSAYWTLYLIYNIQGNAEEAAEIWKTATLFNPEAFNTRFHDLCGAGDRLYNENKYAAAIRAYTEAIQSDPQYSSIHSGKAFTKDPLLADLFYKRSQANKALDNKTEASEDEKIAIKLGSSKQLKKTKTNKLKITPLDDTASSSSSSSWSPTSSIFSPTTKNNPDSPTLASTTLKKRK